MQGGGFAHRTRARRLPRRGSRRRRRPGSGGRVGLGDIGHTVCGGRSRLLPFGIFLLRDDRQVFVDAGQGRCAVRLVQAVKVLFQLVPDGAHGPDARRSRGHQTGQQRQRKPFVPQKSFELFHGSLLQSSFVYGPNSDCSVRWLRRVYSVVPIKNKGCARRAHPLFFRIISCGGGCCPAGGRHTGRC